MENRPKSWLTGCGCGCLSHVAAFVLVYGLCVGASFVAWEVFDIRERFLRGESVLVWGAAVGAGFAFVVGLVMVFVMQRVAFKRFEKASFAAVQPPGPGVPAPGAPAPPAPGAGVDGAPGAAPGAMGMAAPPPGPAPAGAGQDAPRPGCLMPGIWLGINGLFTLGGLGALAVGAMESERLGVLMSQLVAAPIGLAWAGFLAAAVVHLFFKRAGTGVRVGVPIGCGLVGAVTAVSLLFFFFAVIWPEL